MPLLSIVVPTRNRQLTALTLIRVVLERIPDCQVIVTDNSDDSTLRELLREWMEDQRLIYRYYAEQLSVVENFNRAIEFAEGEYICLLGDDDMIGPGICEVVEWAKKNSIDAVSYRSKGRELHYFWPGVTHKYWGEMGGKLLFSHFTGEVERLNVKETSLDAVLHLGSGPRQMPRVYLGLISKELLAKVRERYGNLFGGFSPDVYSSQLLSGVCENAAVVDYPMIIPGGSPKSTSATRAKRADVGELTANDHLGRFDSVVWDARIPRYYSPFTVWAQTHINALMTTGSLIPSRAFAHLYAVCILFTPKHYREVFTSITSNGSVAREISMVVLTGVKLFQVTVRYVMQKMPLLVRRRPSAAAYQEVGIPDTEAALDRLTNVLSSRGMNLRLKQI